MTNKLSSSLVRECIDQAYEEFKDIELGKNADYIPYLDNVDSSLFGIAVTTCEGETFTVGDTDYKFGIESISKVSTAILAMNQYSPIDVMKSIGADATGLPFNSIAAMVDAHGRSSSPLVNAGAISCCSMIQPTGQASKKWEEIVKINSELCGSEVYTIEELYQSESLTNYNNRAISWILKRDGLIYDEPELSLDLYTRQCSLAVDCQQMANFGATIANKGVNPVSQKKVFDEEIAPKIISLMAIQGFYEMSGHWLYSAGIPAKSGVGGGVVGVMPHKFGIAAFSPRLDEAGNSVRAQRAIKHIVKRLNCNIFY